MGNSKALIQLVLALVLAVAAGLMVFQWMASQKQSAPVAKIETSPVVVAALDLPRGVTLKPDMLRVADYPQSALPAQLFDDPAQLTGRVLLSAVGENEPVTPLRLAGADNATAGVAAMISPGHRAMAVKGNKVMGMSGFIRPGDRVDIIATLMTGEQNSEAVTKTVLEDILVLATGEEFEPNTDGDPSSVDTYTLEVTPEESEFLALSANQGTLNFALRSQFDDKTVLTKGANISATLAAYRPVARPKASQKARNTVKIEIITGAERSTQEF